MDSARRTIVRFQPLSGSTGTITVVEADNGWNRTIVRRAESMQKSMHMHKILPIF
jgi:IS1 family transposase